MNTLKDELKEIVGKQRRFLLFRIAEIETAPAISLCKLSQGTYNSWTTRVSRFTELYRKLEELQANYKQEAIQLLRRDNQLSAVMLEERIIEKMKEEIDSGDYNLIRTNLARDVYTKLIGDLDLVPAGQAQTWEGRLASMTNVFVNGQQSPPQIVTTNRPIQIGESDEIIEATALPVEEHKESLAIQANIQENIQEPDKESQ